MEAHHTDTSKTTEDTLPTINTVSQKSVIVVVSRARSELILSRGLTLNSLSASKKYSVYLAIREDERYAYKAVFEKYPSVVPMILPLGCEDSGMYRDAILRQKIVSSVEKVAICDDDLGFSYRDWTGPHLLKLPKERIDEAFDALFAEITEETPHVGFRQRQFAQNCVNPVDEYKRIMWVHGLHRPSILREKVSFAWDCKVMVDFHFQLELIRRGYRTAVINSFVTDDQVGPYKNAGGCNIYRNAEECDRAARELAKRYPEAVTLRYKSTPKGKRADVTVHFGKARPS